jgi:protein-disulfide isomerase
MAVIAGVVLLVLGAIILPGLLTDETQQLGEIVPVTPVSYTNAEGTRLGDPNAPVKIEVFEDFQCPACRTYTSSYEPAVIQNLVETGQAYYVFYQYPFLDDSNFSKDSDQAAMAALCAADQGRFWDYKNLLFANSQESAGVFSADRLKQLAESLDLNMETFNACYDSGEHEDVIQQELALGKQMGVTGTPSVFVNGQDVAPGKVPTFEQIQAAVLAAGSD